MTTWDHQYWGKIERKALKRKVALKRSTEGLARTGLKRKRSSSPTRKLRHKVMMRCRGLCEAKTSDKCVGVMEHVHHRLMRSQGGTHDLDNLLGVCHICHKWIHDHPTRSYELGHLIRRQ